MPINVTNPTSLRNFNFGRTEQGLPAIPANATPQQLRQLLDTAWSSIADGSKLSKAEAAWLQQLATASGADQSVLDAIHDKASSLPIAESRSSTEISRFISSLKPAPGGQPVAQPAVTTGTGTGGAGVLNLLSSTANLNRGRLTPTNDSVALTPRMAEVIKPADQALKLDVINDTFNPLKDTIGPFSKPSEMYQGKTLVPVQDLIGGALQGQIKQQLVAAGVPADQLPAALEQKMAEFGPLLGSLSKDALLKNSAHQFNVDGKPGNRVALYGGATGHQAIDQIVGELGQQNMRAMKIMSHINAAGQGGDIKSVLGDGVLGVTHTGGFSSGVKGGKPLSVKSDWPSDYGRMDDSHKDYNAVMVAVDYQAGANKPIPQESLAAYKHNADMWDVAAGMTVPFASQDPDSRYTDYKYNPLDVHDHASSVGVAKSLAKLDWNAVKADGNGAFYCAEGQWSMNNLGPKGETLISEQQYGDTKLGELIKNYQASVGELETNPQKGWEALKKGAVISEQEFAANQGKPFVARDWPQAGWLHMAETGKITQEQYQHLANTDRTATYMEFVKPDVKGWEAYEPINKEGLIAKPMTVATMAWGLIRSTMPREQVAKTVAGDLIKSYQTGDDTVKAQIRGLLGGAEPTTPAGQKALGELGMKAATGLLLNALGSPDFKNQLLAKSGYNEITNDADKAQFNALFDEFLGTLKDPALMANQAAMDAKIIELDDKFRNLEVERQVRDPATGNLLPKKTGPMLYAAPNSMLLYAQHPELYESNALRYVTNLQHVEQAGLD